MQLLIVANSVETFWIAKSQLRISQGILQGSLLRRPRGGGDSGRSPILIVRQGRKGTKPSKDDCLGLSEVESKHLVKCTRFLEIYHIESIHVYTYYEYMIWLQNDSLDPKKNGNGKKHDNMTNIGGSITSGSPTQDPPGSRSCHVSKSRRFRPWCWLQPWASKSPERTWSWAFCREDSVSLNFLMRFGCMKQPNAYTK